jgi:hypothetical protein
LHGAEHGEEALAEHEAAGGECGGMRDQPAVRKSRGWREAVRRLQLCKLLSRKLMLALKHATATVCSLK